MLNFMQQNWLHTFLEEALFRNLAKLNFRFLQGKYNATISHGNFSCSSRKHNL